MHVLTPDDNYEYVLDENGKIIYVMNTKGEVVPLLPRKKVKFHTDCKLYDPYARRCTRRMVLVLPEDLACKYIEKK